MKIFNLHSKKSIKRDIELTNRAYSYKIWRFIIRLKPENVIISHNQENKSKYCLIQTHIEHLLTNPKDIEKYLKNQEKK